ncbi:hypothetical protein [Thiomicrorhabdus sp. 6S3-12]
MRVKLYKGNVIVVGRYF